MDGRANRTTDTRIFSPLLYQTIAPFSGQRVKLKALIASLIAILGMNLRFFGEIPSVRFEWWIQGVKIH